ncbi:MAG: hypothetical protein JSS78_02180 [Bacteroidetes bacterium]|nr:hypothetical protein [Bacteroidota bacterium]
MLFGILSRCDSMGEVCDGLRGLEGKLNYFGIDKSPAKSTVCDRLRGWEEAFFKDVYFMLSAHFKPLLSVSRIDNTEKAAMADIDKIVELNDATIVKEVFSLTDDEIAKLYPE